MKRELVIATRNKKKLREIKRLLTGSRVKVISLARFSRVPNIIEDGRTFSDNAAKKALVVSKYTDKLVLADDSGLMVDALNGKPGVHSSRYAGPKKRDADNIAKLLKALEGKPGHKRSARFKCVVALARNNRIIKLIGASCEGVIGSEIQGLTGFGYDPVFMPRGHKKSFAMLGPKVKDKLSHRGKALRSAKKAIEKYLLKAL